MEAIIGYAQIIVPILLFIFALRFLYIFAKRCLLLLKLSHFRGRVEWRRAFRSMFTHDGDIDFIVHSDSGDIAVSVFTTMKRRTRYHFDGKGNVELIRARRGMFMVNRRVPNAGASVDTVTTVKSYSIGVPVSGDYAQHVLLVYPAPAEISTVEGNQIVPVGNGDTVGGYTVSSLSHFTEAYLKDGAGALI